MIKRIELINNEEKKNLSEIPTLDKKKNILPL